MEKVDYKLCPSCHHSNRVSAKFCENCGKPIEAGDDPHATTTEVKKPKLTVQENLEEQLAKVSRAVPAEGIAVYIAGQTQPIEVLREDQFVIGRLVEPTEETVVDLSEFNAFDQGVSRRHLMVRRVENGYEVTDLHSRNGTWVEDQFLAPQTPRAIKSGALIRLGLFRVILVFQQDEKRR